LAIDLAAVARNSVGEVMINTVFQSLQRRLVLIFGLALLVPFAFGVWASFDRYVDALRAARDAAQGYAMLASNYETNVLWQTHQISESLINHVSILAVAGGGSVPADLSQCRAVMAQAIAPFPDLGNATLFAPDGRALCRGFDVQQAPDVSAKPWFRQALAGTTPSYSGYEISPRRNEPILLYLRPVLNDAGRALALLAISIRLNWLLSIGQEPGLPPDAEITLLDRHGTILVSSPVVGDAGAGRLPDAAHVRAIAEGTLRRFEARGGDGTDRIYAVNSLAQNSIFVVLGIPWQSVIGPIRFSLMIQLAAIAFVSIAGMIAAVIAGRILVTRWTEKLTLAAATASLGALAVESEMKGAPREIHVLAETLHDMAVQVETREMALRRALDRERAVVREIHHRVKNNLQIVTSLLNLYQRQLPIDRVDQGFSDLQTRIKALALIHRHLYESEDLKEIDLAPFMSGLCKLLGDGSGLVPGQVAIALDVPEMRMQDDCAIPLALLTTELITHSLNHLSAAGRQGKIEVRLTIGQDCSGELVVADDRPASMAAAAETPVLGDISARLIQAFVRQIGGTLEQSGPPAFRSVIRFSIRKPERLAPEI
jgi:two-component sensor histidine kinase